MHTINPDGYAVTAPENNPHLVELMKRQLEGMGYEIRAKMGESYKDVTNQLAKTGQILRFRSGPVLSYPGKSGA